MQWIHSLKPNVTREQALSQLQGQGLGRVLRCTLAGPLRSIADVYVPFRVFSVNIQSTGRQQKAIIGIDAVTGDFDLYSFDEIPGANQLVEVRTSNRPDAVLTEAQAREFLIERVRRLVFRQGFFRLRNLRIEAEPIDLAMHIPYWLGFSGFSERAHVTALDAVRRRLEGGKVRLFFHEWLAASPAEMAHRLR